MRTASLSLVCVLWVSAAAAQVRVEAGPIKEVLLRGEPVLVDVVITNVGEQSLAVIADLAQYEVWRPSSVRSAGRHHTEVVNFPIDTLNLLISGCTALATLTHHVRSEDGWDVLLEHQQDPKVVREVATRAQATWRRWWARHRDRLTIWSRRTATGEHAVIR